MDDSPAKPEPEILGLIMAVTLNHLLTQDTLTGAPLINRIRC